MAASCLLRSDVKSFGDVATIGDVVRIITENTCPGCGYMSYGDDGKCFECEEEKEKALREAGQVSSIGSIKLEIIFHSEKEGVLLNV